jgi:hypothetical protein
MGGYGQLTRKTSSVFSKNIMKRRFKTDADIDRHIKEGFGLGDGSSYKPWIRVQDISSVGRSRKTPGFKSGRLHHTLSDLEYYYLLLLEFSDEVVDIREQYPLFATPRARDLAAEMGIRYPNYLGTQLPLVITSDFALTIQVPDGKTRLAIRTCKYESELTDPQKGPRIIEKLELERAIWAEHGVTDWKIVTDRLMEPILKDNLQWLHGSAWVESNMATEEQKMQFIEAAVHTADGIRTLASVVRSISNSVGLPYSNGTSLFKYLVWNKFLLTDLSAARLSLTLPCPVLRRGTAVQPDVIRREVA